jgi:hypothetical protein
LIASIQLIIGLFGSHRSNHTIGNRDPAGLQIPPAGECNSAFKPRFTAKLAKSAKKKSEPRITQMPRMSTASMRDIRVFRGSLRHFLRVLGDEPHFRRFTQIFIGPPAKKLGE